jgi:Raf kinase inhibitor-like YbhB/YbcL family protein
MLARSPSRHTRAALILALSVLPLSPAIPGGGEEAGTMSLALSSEAFPDGGEIPSRFTCDGEDVSPPLEWTGVPVSAKSLVLIVDDPDAPDPRAPKMTWVHWVLFDIPADSSGLVADVGEAGLPRGTRGGLNDWKRTGWGGPCPPVGRHRYFFKLYAIDERLGDLGVPTKSDIEAAIEGHVLAEARLVGTYERRR